MVDLQETRAKIARGQETYCYLRNELEEFFAKSPVTFVLREAQGDIGSYVISAANVPTVPNRLLTLVSECLFHARSMFDLLAFALAEEYAPAYVLSNPRAIYFPVYSKESEYRQKRVQQFVGLLPPALTAEFLALQPFSTPASSGVPIMAMIADLNNFDKHTRLHSLGLRALALNPGLKFPAMQTTTVSNAVIEEGTIVANMSGLLHGSVEGADFDIALGVVFSRQGALWSGADVSEIVGLILNFAEDVIDRFEILLTPRVE